MNTLTPTAPRLQTRKLNLGATPAPDIDAIDSAIKDYSERNDVPRSTRPSEEKAIAAAAVAAVTEGIGSNVTPLRKARAGKKERAPNIRTGIDLPDYVKKAIAKKALDENVTLRFLHLKALRAIGITVNDVDFEEDGRRAK
jgi:hypothetical protein